MKSCTHLDAIMDLIVSIYIYCNLINLFKVLGIEKAVFKLIIEASGRKTFKNRFYIWNCEIFVLNVQNFSGGIVRFVKIEFQSRSDCKNKRN